MKLYRSVVEGGEDVWFTKERGEPFGEGGGGYVEGGRSISYVEEEEEKEKDKKMMMMNF